MKNNNYAIEIDLLSGKRESLNSFFAVLLCLLNEENRKSITFLNKHLSRVYGNQFKKMTADIILKIKYTKTC